MIKKIEDEDVILVKSTVATVFQVHWDRNQFIQNIQEQIMVSKKYAIK